MNVFVIKCLNCSEELEETYKFCSRCGVAVDKEEVLIRYYFQRGFPYFTYIILLFLKNYHALEMSLRTFHIGFASTDCEEGIQRVTMLKFSRLFNKN